MERPGRCGGDGDARAGHGGADGWGRGLGAGVVRCQAQAAAESRHTLRLLRGIPADTGRGEERLGGGGGGGWWGGAGGALLLPSTHSSKLCSLSTFPTPSLLLSSPYPSLHYHASSSLRLLWRPAPNRTAGSVLLGSAWGATRDKQTNSASLFSRTADPKLEVQTCATGFTEDSNMVTNKVDNFHRFSINT